MEPARGFPLNIHVNTGFEQSTKSTHFLLQKKRNKGKDNACFIWSSNPVRATSGPTGLITDWQTASRAQRAEMQRNNEICGMLKRKPVNNSSLILPLPGQTSQLCGGGRLETIAHHKSSINTLGLTISGIAVPHWWTVAGKTPHPSPSNGR